MLMKEICNVQNGMFLIFLPSSFSFVQAQEDRRRGGDVHTCIHVYLQLNFIFFLFLLLYFPDFLSQISLPLN